MIGAALTASLLGVVEGLRAGGHTLTLIQVALHPKLVCGGKCNKAMPKREKTETTDENWV